VYNLLGKWVDEQGRKHKQAAKPAAYLFPEPGQQLYGTQGSTGCFIE